MSSHSLSVHKMPRAMQMALRLSCFGAAVIFGVSSARVHAQGAKALPVLAAAGAAQDTPRRGGGGAGLGIVNHDSLYEQAMAQRQALLGRITPITAQTLRDPPAADWLMWRGNYGATGYSKLDQINTGNAHDLGVAWSLTLPVSGNEGAPLVHDGVLFVESADTVEALDGTNGDLLWKYVRPLPAAMRNGRAEHAKSLAIYQDMLYVPAFDGHVVALDVKSGKVLWDTNIVPPGQRFGGLQTGPLVADGKVVIGVDLGNGAPGGSLIVGLDGQTGTKLWQFHTIPRPGQPGGNSWNGLPVEQRFGAGTWTVGSYDPGLNQVYFGIGNTYDIVALLRKTPKGQTADGLYTESTVALDPDTGKLVWYYQHMNHDVWDLDWTYEQTLVTLPINGKPTRLLVTGGKQGIFDVLDRANGKYEFSQEAGAQNLVTRIDPKTGHKVINPAFAQPEPGRNYVICPGFGGGRNWPTTAFDPMTDVLYVPWFDMCMNFRYTPKSGADASAGGSSMSTTVIPRPGGDGKLGGVVALDLKTHKIAWKVRQRAPAASSLLATAGGVLFSGSDDRIFHAYDGAHGTLLWQIGLDAAPSSSPVTYSIDGVQYVAVLAGAGSPLDLGNGSLAPELTDPTGGMTLWVFKLRSEAPARQ